MYKKLCTDRTKNYFGGFYENKFKIVVRTVVGRNFVVIQKGIKNIFVI